MIDDALGRIRAARAPGPRFAVLLRKNGAPDVAAALQAELAREPGIAFTTITRRETGPVPTGDGGHVNAQEYAFEPFPALVVLVSESDGVIYIAARAPGSDPLGSGDWAWTLQTRR